MSKLAERDKKILHLEEEIKKYRPFIRVNNENIDKIQQLKDYLIKNVIPNGVNVDNDLKHINSIINTTSR